jgi:hypothetical protein
VGIMGISACNHNLSLCIVGQPHQALLATNNTLDHALFCGVLSTRIGCDA